MGNSIPDKFIYRRIAVELMDELQNNPVAMANNFPKIRDLQTRFQCSAFTAHKALGVLKNKGLLQVRQGRRSIPMNLPRHRKSCGNILLVFPTWDQLGGQSFAAEFVLGASTELAANGYAAIPCPCASWAWLHGNPSENSRLLDALSDPQYAGIIWANPTLNESAILASLEARELHIVTAIRSHNGVTLPQVTEDFSEAFDALARQWAQLKIAHILVHAPYNADHTYMPQLRFLQERCRHHGIIIRNEDCFSRIDEGNSLGHQKVILNALLTNRNNCQALFSFSPELYQPFAALRKEGLIPEQIQFGCLSKRTTAIHGARWIIESNIAAHGTTAANMLLQWLDKDERPQNRTIKAIFNTEHTYQTQ